MRGGGRAGERGRRAAGPGREAPSGAAGGCPAPVGLRPGPPGRGASCLATAGWARASCAPLPAGALPALGEE